MSREWIRKLVRATPSLQAHAKELLAIEGDGFVLLKNEVTGEVTIVPGRNLVTDEGDKFYAQSACGEPPTNAFDSNFLATAGPDPVTKSDDYGDFTVVVGSEKAKTAGYPKTADADGDNPPPGSGVDIISWLFEYTTGDGPFTNITHSFVAEAGASGVDDPILNSYKWAAAWSKDGSTSCKIFYNHTVTGA